MKKIFLFLLSPIVLSSALAACKNPDSSPGNSCALSIQEVYDKSKDAEQYAEGLFAEQMQKKNLPYEIQQTACGFITGNSPVYIIGYQYTSGESTGIYGYRITFDYETDRYTVTEEGMNTAESLFSSQTFSEDSAL